MDEGLKRSLTKLKSIKDTARSVLFVASGASSRVPLLLEWLSFIEDSRVHPELGNALLLGSSLEEESEGQSVKVDDVRQALSQLSLQRWDQNKTRYVLIPYAENLTAQSFNALLKSLEEPPEGTVFILFAPTRKSLLKTVLSRCLIVHLGHLHPASKSDSELSNPFFKAFFENDCGQLKALTKESFLTEWKIFYKSLPSYYSLRQNESITDWFELFSYIDSCNQSIELRTDYKWLVADIESVKEF